MAAVVTLRKKVKLLLIGIIPKNKMTQNIENILEYWKRFKELVVNMDSHGDLDLDELKCEFELHTDILAGIIISIEKNSQEPFLKFFPALLESFNNIDSFIEKYNPESLKLKNEKKQIIEKNNILKKITKLIQYEYKSKIPDH